MKIGNYKLKAVTIMVAIFIALFLWMKGCEEAEASELTIEVGPVVTRGNTDGAVLLISEIWNKKYETGIGLLSPTMLESGGENWNPFAIFYAYRHVNWKQITLGLGATYWQHKDGESVGSGQITFTEVIRFHVTDGMMFSYRHWSNGGGGKKGFGQDAFLIGFKF